MNAPLINIGASQAAVKEARTAVLKIVQSNADDYVKIVALRALTAACQVNNTMISNCNFDVSKA